MNAQDIMFVILAVFIVCSAFATVISRSIVRAATYLLFVLLGTAVFYFQLGYEFLGAVQIAVYAGGIMVLFVFSILLTRRPDEKAPLLSTHRRGIGVALALVSFILLGLALFYMPFLSGVSLAQSIEAGATIDMHTIGQALVGSDKFQYLLPFEAISVLLLACIIGGVTVARKR